MHLSMVCPRMGRGGGKDSLKCTWVGNLTSWSNIPRMGNLTQPPSWKVEDQGMNDKRSAILENTQQSFGRVSHILMCSFLYEGRQNETCFSSLWSFMTKSILSLSIEKQYLHSLIFLKTCFLLTCFHHMLPCRKFLIKWKIKKSNVKTWKIPGILC